MLLRPFTAVTDFFIEDLVYTVALQVLVIHGIQWEKFSFVSPLFTHRSIRDRKQLILSSADFFQFSYISIFIYKYRQGLHGGL